MYLRGRIFSVCVLCVVVAMAACAAQRTATLPKRVRAYHEACKWKEFSAASAYAADIENFNEKVKNSETRIEINEYEVLSITISENKTEAIVEVRRVYTIAPSVSVHTQVLEQKWKYDRERKDWFLVTPY